MKPKKKLPLSISTFARLIKEDYLYVDKTEYIYKMLMQSGAFFLSRPRRFGKSLLLSTIKEIFLGNRDLFTECWIYKRIPWEPYPVIHLDFLKVPHKELGLTESLSIALNQIAKDHKIKIKGESLYEKFSTIIHKLAKKKPVVILIDEYDKPITDNLDNIEQAEKNRETLKNFYSVLKAQQEYIHFLFMTGVSRFSRLSIFSDLNHLIDITLYRDFAPMLGYTTEDIELYFNDYIEEYYSTNPGLPRETFFKTLKEHYNGYSWDGTTFVYNPISINHFFYQKEFKSFWFATGTPTFLVKMARTKEIDIRNWEELTVNEQFFDKFDISNINTNLLLFQTGYLTIKKKIGDAYYLSYPNREVENALLFNLLEEFSGQSMEISNHFVLDIKDSLHKKDLDGFIEKMKAFLSAIPYTLVIGDVEKYYHLVFYLVLKMALGKTHAEHFSNRGRMDMLVETEHYFYIMEFKLNKAENALKQIQNKGYYEQLLTHSKTIILLGIGFDRENRNISDYLFTEINPT